MTPDLAAGLLIGSFVVYACWLLSLRLADQEKGQHPIVDADLDTASRKSIIPTFEQVIAEMGPWEYDDITFDFPHKAHILPRPKGPRPKPATQPPDPVLAALLVLGEELDDA